MKHIPPNALIDALLQVENVKNDAELSRQLNLTPSVVSKMRKHGGCSDEFRVAVMRQYGWTLAGIDNFAPPAPKA